MSNPYSEEQLSEQLDAELTWRRKELSDLKSAIRAADAATRIVLLRALVTMAYAHWEGYVRASAKKYFRHLTLKKLEYHKLERQFYKNHFIVQLESFFRARAKVEECSNFVGTVIDSREQKFSSINDKLIDTRSNLNTSVMKDLCIVCGVQYSYFEDKKIFIDKQLVEKRNAIAHGQDAGLGFADSDEFVRETLEIITQFKTLLENKIYSKEYLSSHVKPRA